MLSCGSSIFAGNAGYRLPLPAGLPLGEQPPEGQWQHRAEVQIARKLQCIADQFHRLHMQQVGLRGWGGAGLETAGAGKPGPAFVLSVSYSGGARLQDVFQSFGLGCCHYDGLGRRS